jgi:hypothetical protein
MWKFTLEVCIINELLGSEYLRSQSPGSVNQEITAFYGKEKFISGFK